MKKLYLLLFTSLLVAFSFAGTITSTATGGNWSATTTWVGGVAPAAGDDVIIADGSTVTADITTSCNSLTVGGGTSGTLVFNTSANVSLTVSGTVTISTGASILSSNVNPASLRTHSISIGGDLINNGTINFTAFANSKVNTMFTGAANNTFITSPTASTTFNNITINKGSSYSNVLDFNPSNTVTLPATGFLTISNGTFKLSGTVSISNQFFLTSTYIIGSTSGFWLNNPNAVVTAQASASVLLGGLIQITNGTYNAGTTASLLFSASSTGNLIIQGGTLNVSARLQVSAAGSTFNMSGGTVNVATVGNTTSASASFAAAGNFIMSGGNITIGVASSGTTKLDYNVSAIAPAITAGTLQLGTAATLASSSFNIQGITPNIVLSNVAGTNPGITQSDATTVYGNMTLNGSGTYIKGAFPLTIKGCSAANPGNIIISGTNALNINGSALAANALSFTSNYGNQTLTLGSGSIVSNQLPSVTINNTFPGGTVTLPSGLSIMPNATLALTRGIYNAGTGGTGTLTLGTTTAGTFTCIRTLGSLAASTVTFGSGTTTKSYTYDGPATINPGPELTTAASPIISALTVNNTLLNLTLNKTINVTSSLTLTSGIISTTTTNQLYLGTATVPATVSGGSASSYVNGPCVRYYAASSGGAASYTGNTIFPVGKNGIYMPVYLDPTVSSAGTLQLRAEAFDTNSGTNISATGGTIAPHRWEAFAINSTAAYLLDGIYIQLSDALISPSNNILKATSAAGVYSSIIPLTSKMTGAVSANVPGMTAAEFTGSGYFSFGDGCNPMGGPNDICLGSTGQVYTTYSLNSPSSGTWSSSAPGIASIDASGVITGAAAGSATIMFIGTAADACNGLTVVKVVNIVNCAGSKPGAVGTNITLWLKSNHNTILSGAVSQLDDKSGLNNHAVQTTTSLQPTIASSLLNYNQQVAFDGVDDVLPGTLANSSVISGTNAFSVFTVFMPNRIPGANIIYGNKIAVGNNTGFVYYRGSGVAVHRSSVGDILAGQSIVVGTSYISLFTRSGSTFSSYLNGSTPLTATNSNSIVAATYAIGGTTFSTDRMSGNIAEIITYNKSVNSLERVKITSYLCLKYGLTMDNSAGGSAGDYLLSDGTNAWSTALTPAYHKQVIGIVRDDASALMQKQSQTIDDSLRLFVGSLSASNLSNTGSISIDKSALVMGNDGGGPQWSASVAKPASVASRLVRTFKVTNTNFTNNFSIEIKCDTIGGLYNLGNLRFLVSTTPDFSAATVYAAPDVTFAFGSIIVNGISNSLIPANTTRYVTVGLSLVVLPIELTAFTAEAVDNKKVNLNWQTAAVTSNDYFTVQKSGNGNQWMDVEKVKAESFISTTRAYKVVDNNPLKGISYYRLYHPGINGEQRYSPIRTVHIYTNTLLLAYPNPSSGNITIEGTAAELSQLKFFTITGQDVSGQIQVISRNSSKIVVDLSRLSKGIYMMKTNTTVTKLFKQ